MFERFSDGARRVVAGAEEEARRLGHGQIGTEHLLLGVLADERSAGTRALMAAGATMDGCRSKVVEAVGPAAGGARPGVLDFTERARRALDRADRLSLRRRDDQVMPEHVLLSVLDVEGRAGQVLRGLGVDVSLLHDSVVAALDRGPGPADGSVAGGGVAGGGATGPAAVGGAGPAAVGGAGPAEVGATAVQPRCPACRARLDAGVSHRVVSSGNTGGPDQRHFALVYCPECGLILGAAGL